MNAAAGAERRMARLPQRQWLWLAIGLALAACNPQETNEHGDTVGSNTVAAENPPPEQAAAEGGATASAARTAGNQAPGAEPAVMVSQAAPLRLVDASGNSLYALEGNRDGSKCDAQCESAWPPVVAHGSRPSAAPGMQPGMLGTLPRADGSLHMTYDGNPLYRYSGDMGVANTAGQGVSDKWGQWHLVGADGGFVEQPVSGEGATNAAQPPTGTGEEGQTRDADGGGAAGDDDQGEGGQ